MIRNKYQKNFSSKKRKKKEKKKRQRNKDQNFKINHKRT